MTEPDFVHLHVHTQYSLLDGAIRLNRLFERATQYGMSAVAITDHGSMFGVLDFYQQAHKAGIKPVIGCECYVAPRTIADRTPQDHQGLSHLVLLAENMEGYRNLCALVSMGHLKGFYHKPRIDKLLLREHHKGLIALSACLHGEIPMAIKQNNLEAAEQAALFYQELFGDDHFYLEVQNNGIEVQETVNQALREMSGRLSIPLVASNDCHYLDKSDVRAHDVLLCIQTGKTINDDGRFKFRTDQLYFKSKAEMLASFADYPGALANTLDIAERCNLEFDLKSYHFPRYERMEGATVDDLFEKHVRQGFAEVAVRIRAKNPDMDEAVYARRLDYEIGVIKDMGFSGYFLIVADFIGYAKSHNIPVGPGRGSAAGSLVAYSLGITNLNPIEYGLIFERFLNPSRKSMPDIDVDFCINGRDEVFKYVVQRYGGYDYVAQIITFGKLKTRAVIRDVGRALDIPLREVDAIAKMVPDVLNISLDEALKQEPRLQEMTRSRPEIDELITICRVLEGLTRHVSTHAAGVVIADRPLVEYLPLYRGKKDEVVTQFDMNCVEKIGLVKFDFLGLRNLTVIAATLKLIADQGVTPPDLDNLDFNDTPTYRLLGSGDTTGVFQLESSGMKDLLVRLKPECFEDIIALVALYRPGPLDSGMVDDFVERKHGRKAVEYLIPELAPILQETYGVIVYQEQVMKIAAALASYSMAEADDLRKAMGKKIPEILARHRERFVTGATENGIAGAKAAQLFDLIEKFGGYGFNKSHSAAYALIAFQTAWLKAHYPVTFMAALLSSEMHSSDGVIKYISECRGHAISILPPDINHSARDFTVDGQAIRFGLMAVKNVGEGAIESIIEARQEAPFTSLFDFCTRANLKKINKRVLETLIKCGAFDSTGARRACMAAALEEALEYGQRIQRERDDPQMGLFDMGDSRPVTLNAPVLPNLTEWDENERLLFEKEALGFYVSGHPLQHHADLLARFTNAHTAQIAEMSNGAAVRLGGIVRSIKVITTKKGDNMAFITLEDMHGSIEITVFASCYAEARDLLVSDSLILVQGEIQKDDTSAKLLAETIVPLEKAEETWTTRVCITLEAARVTPERLPDLYALLQAHPGNAATLLRIQLEDGAEVRVAPPHLKVKPDAALFEAATELLGYAALESVCGPITCNVTNRRNGKNGWSRRQ